MSCTEFHTVYQPKDAEWKCPKCGSYDLYNTTEREEDCCALHLNDILECEHCGYVDNGEGFANKIMRDLGVKVCLFCSGKGYTEGEVGWCTDPPPKDASEILGLFRNGPRVVFWACWDVGGDYDSPPDGIECGWCLAGDDIVVEEGDPIKWMRIPK